jgi:hypothetical protein
MMSLTIVTFRLVSDLMALLVFLVGIICVVDHVYLYRMQDAESPEWKKLCQ